MRVNEVITSKSAGTRLSNVSRKSNSNPGARALPLPPLLGPLWMVTWASPSLAVAPQLAVSNALLRMPSSQPAWRQQGWHSARRILRLPIRITMPLQATPRCQGLYAPTRITPRSCPSSPTARRRYRSPSLTGLPSCPPVVLSWTGRLVICVGCCALLHSPLPGVGMGTGEEG